MQSFRVLFLAGDYGASVVASVAVDAVNVREARRTARTMLPDMREARTVVRYRTEEDESSLLDDVDTAASLFALCRPGFYISA